MVVCKLALSTRPTGFSHYVGIIKPNKTFILRAVKREGIFDAVWPFRSYLDTFDIEFDPKARFVDYIRVAVEGQKILRP